MILIDPLMIKFHDCGPHREIESESRFFIQIFFAANVMIGLGLILFGYKEASQYLSLKHLSVIVNAAIITKITLFNAFWQLQCKLRIVAALLVNRQMQIINLLYIVLSY